MNALQGFSVRAGIVTALAIVSVACACILFGCQGNQSVEESYEPAVSEVDSRPSARIEIVDDRVFWGEGEALWTAELNSDGSLSSFENLGEFNDRIRGIVHYDTSIYVLTIEGIYRMDLGETADGAELIVDEGARDDMWATSEGLFYRREGTVSRASLTGSDEVALKDGVKDFVVAGDKLYVLEEDGSFKRMNFEGTDEEELEAARERHDDSVLLADNNDVYIVSSELTVCRGSSEELESVDLSHEIEVPDRTVIADGMVLYESGSEACYRHKDGEDDDEKLDHPAFRGKPYARVEDGTLYYTISGDDVTVVDLESLEYEVYDADSDKGKQQEKNESASTENNAESDDGYDISEDAEMHLTNGNAVLTTSHFTLVMNGEDVQQGLWVVEYVDSTTIKFSYSKARDAGYDGMVFSLAAYDWGDNSYAEIPNTHIAGLSEDKKYVVILPSDVRYDPSDEVQKEEYERLREYANSIDDNTNRTGNPFTVNMA